MLNTTNVSASELCEVSSVSAYLPTHTPHEGWEHKADCSQLWNVMSWRAAAGEPGSKGTYLVKLVVLDKLICPSTYMYGVLVCPKQWTSQGTRERNGQDHHSQWHAADMVWNSFPTMDGMVRLEAKDRWPLGAQEKLGHCQFTESELLPPHKTSPILSSQQTQYHCKNNLSISLQN